MYNTIHKTIYTYKYIILYRNILTFALSHTHIFGLFVGSYVEKKKNDFFLFLVLCVVLVVSSMVSLCVFIRFACSLVSWYVFFSFVRCVIHLCVFLFSLNLVGGAVSELFYCVLNFLFLFHSLCFSLSCLYL